MLVHVRPCRGDGQVWVALATAPCWTVNADRKQSF